MTSPHARDIDNERFLLAVQAAAERRGSSTATRWDVAHVLAGRPDLVGTFAEDDHPGLPEKVVLAKARKLIRQGLLRGCDCGCRGDLELADGVELPTYANPIQVAMLVRQIDDRRRTLLARLDA